ncbi:hypothetical protein NDU88_004081 [Pleurodeles waltl]|uniref:Uncharacterized protein n=1 Tax=Pleurodeles waltl TaxID=8319 RepID=A0AAV7T6X7_PLEWA|nr:hypothetical protein NDU88_004081 [Pleurodeles waltl]
MKSVRTPINCWKYDPRIKKLCSIGCMGVHHKSDRTPLVRQTMCYQMTCERLSHIKRDVYYLRIRHYKNSTGSEKAHQYRGFKLEQPTTKIGCTYIVVAEILSATDVSVNRTEESIYIYETERVSRTRKLKPDQSFAAPCRVGSHYPK